MRAGDRGRAEALERAVFPAQLHRRREGAAEGEHERGGHRERRREVQGKLPGMLGNVTAGAVLQRLQPGRDELRCGCGVRQLDGRPNGGDR